VQLLHAAPHVLYHRPREPLGERSQQLRVVAQADRQRARERQRTATIPASECLLHARGRYVLVNGLVVAQNWDALTSGTLETPITVDENSQTQDTRTWTGTLSTGQPAQGSEFCEDWDDDRPYRPN